MTPFLVLAFALAPAVLAAQQRILWASFPLGREAFSTTEADPQRHSSTAVVHAAAFAQSSTVRLQGVAEPPELLGASKTQQAPPTETERLFFEVFTNDRIDNDIERSKNIREKLTTFIQAHPDYADAYFMRAILTRCDVKDGDRHVVLSDLTRAIATHSSAGSHIATLAVYHAVRAKVHFEMGLYRDAMADLDIAITQNVRSANEIFRTAGIKPTAYGDSYSWSQADLDTLSGRSPTDYRPLLYRGLYFRHFATFDDKYAGQAIQDFRRASVLNPKAALPHYFIGDLQARQGFLGIRIAWDGS